MRFKEEEYYYLDTKTGLEWSKENFGPMNWHKSINWRLPTIEELLTLVDYTIFNPATELPGMISSYYWSSTTNASYTDGAWLVDFDNGSVSSLNKYNNYYIRAVRKIGGHSNV